MTNDITAAIACYLRSGHSDPIYGAWSGDVFERGKRGHQELLRALAEEVKHRAAGRQHPAIPDLDLTSWTRRKLTPMVHGLFPQAEREAVLSLLERSVVFLTADNIARVLLGQSWLHSAWSLANLYLSSVDAELLGPDAPRLLGLSQETICYVSTEYFGERGEIEDFVIHEAAHVFHNCKRKTAGLPETRTREWLLDIEFRKRETFAYSCEMYGWIVEHASSPAERQERAEEFSKKAHRLNEETIEPAEVAEIVREACEARGGWKVILGRCSPCRTAARESRRGLSDGSR